MMAYTMLTREGLRRVKAERKWQAETTAAGVAFYYNYIRQSHQFGRSLLAESLVIILLCCWGGNATGPAYYSVQHPGHCLPNNWLAPHHAQLAAAATNERRGLDHSKLPARTTGAPTNQCGNDKLDTYRR